MAHRFVIADVFTETAFGGNQLAVFPDARGLSDRAVQALAREFNFAETTFVLPPDDPRHTHRVRIFTPTTEMPFAGRPTVGTAAALARLDLIPVPDGAATVVLEEGVGPVAVEIRLDGASTMTRLTLETDVESPPERPEREAVAAALTLPSDAVADAWFVSVGVPLSSHRPTRGSDYVYLSCSGATSMASRSGRTTVPRMRRRDVTSVSYALIFASLRVMFPAQRH